MALESFTLKDIGLIVFLKKQAENSLLFSPKHEAVWRFELKDRERMNESIAWLTNCSEAKKSMFPLTHIECAFVQAEKPRQPLRNFWTDW